LLESFKSYNFEFIYIYVNLANVMIDVSRLIIREMNSITKFENMSLAYKINPSNKR